MRKVFTNGGIDYHRKELIQGEDKLPESRRLYIEAHPTVSLFTRVSLGCSASYVYMSNHVHLH